MPPAGGMEPTNASLYSLAIKYPRGTCEPCEHAIRRGGATNLSQREKSTTSSSPRPKAMKRALTKQACDACSRKKRKCPGDNPCARCRRGGVTCTYSAKAVSRSRSADAHGIRTQPTLAKRAPPSTTHPAAEASAPSAVPRSPPLTVSSATGLQGLQESKFLSVFLEHCAPMYPVADDASIRDGLMHEFVGLCNKDSQDSLRGPEAMRGQSLSCAFFSCVAIGGLMAGCPPAAVAPHLSTAQASLRKFAGLEDVYAIRAYTLYAMAQEYVGGVGPGTEYRVGMEAARRVFEKLPTGEEPVLSAVLSHFMMLEGLPLLHHVEMEVSKDDSLAGAAPPGRGGGKGAPAAARDRNSGTSYVCCKASNEEAIFQKALAIRADVSLVMASRPPPAYVVTDATLLTIRFSRDRGDVATRLLHLHDFASSELARFQQEESGAVATLSIMAPLMGVKIRLGRLDGMLSAAEMASSLLQTCPGLVRIHHCHVAHTAMAVYKLYGRREPYDALRQLLNRTTGQEVPAFEDMTPSARFCQLPLCAMHLEKLLKMEAPRQRGGGCGGGGGGGGGGSGGSLPGSGFGRGGAGAAGATSGGTGGPAAMGKPTNQPGQRPGIDLSSFSSSSFSSRQDQLLAGGSYAGSGSGASSVRASARLDLFPQATAGWGLPAEERGVPRQLLPPAAPRNQLLPTPPHTESDGTPQLFGAVRGGRAPPSAPAEPGSFGASGLAPRGAAAGFPESGFGAKASGSAPLANSLSSDKVPVFGARREQAAGWETPGLSRDYQGGGGGGGGSCNIDVGAMLRGDLAGLTRVEGWGDQMSTRMRGLRDDGRSALGAGEVSPALTGGGSLSITGKHPRSSDGDGGEGGKRGRAELPLPREGQGQRGLELSGGLAASSLPLAFTSTTSDTAAGRGSAVTTADLLNFSYSMFGEEDDPSPPPLD